MTTGKNNPLAKLPELSPELLDESIAVLGLEGDERASELKRHLKAHARSFALGRMISDQHPTVHEDRTRANELVEQIDNLVAGIDGFHPLIYGLNQQAFESYFDGDRSIDDLVEELKVLRDILQGLGQAYFATRQVDLELHHAIGGLMLLLEQFTGRRAMASRQRPDEGKPSQLSSPEAKVIGMVLKAVEPNLAVTTIVGHIGRIRSEHKVKDLSTFAHKLLVGLPAYDDT